MIISMFNMKEIEDRAFLDEGCEILWKDKKYEVIESHDLKLGKEWRTYALCCGGGEMLGVIISEEEDNYLSGYGCSVGRQLFDLMENDEKKYTREEGLRIARIVSDRIDGFKRDPKPFFHECYRH